MAFIQINFPSEALGVMTGVNITIPDCGKVCAMPVLYLFHGLSDNCTNWIRRTSVERYADEAGCILIMPEVQRSFYADMKYGAKYFTYVSQELPKAMKRLFNISSDPEKTYIAGLSMGGYGALKCGLTYPKSYKGIAAFSAVADLQETIDSEILSDLSASETTAIFGEELKIGASNDLFELATKTARETPKEELPRIFMSCGTEDALYSMNLRLKSHIEKLPFEYSFVDWEDGHTWRFWDASIGLALDFFFQKDDDE